jgi:hypothetical protein
MMGLLTVFVVAREFWAEFLAIMIRALSTNIGLQIPVARGSGSKRARDGAATRDSL